MMKKNEFLPVKNHNLDLGKTVVKCPKESQEDKLKPLEILWEDFHASGIQATPRCHKKKGKQN